MSDSGLRFECTQCGLCCTNRGDYAYVYLSPGETKKLAEFLRMPLKAFKREYTFIDEDGWRQLKFDSESCVFLDPETKGCKAYGARPIQCRTFPFWRDLVQDGQWTEEVKRLCEGIGRGRVYDPEEIEVNMVEMELSDAY